MAADAPGRPMLGSGALAPLALQRGPGSVGPALEATSRGLTAASHRVENLRIMRRGEDASTSRPPFRSAPAAG